MTHTIYTDRASVDQEVHLTDPYHSLGSDNGHDAYGQHGVHPFIVTELRYHPEHILKLF